jgi:hypothetical protein
VFDAAKYVENAVYYAGMEFETFADEIKNAGFAGDIQAFYNSLKELSDSALGTAKALDIATDLIIENKYGN